MDIQVLAGDEAGERIPQIGTHIVVLARDEAGNLILQKVNLDTTPLGTELYILASGLELENGNIVLEEFQRPLIYPGLTPRLDGRSYYFDYMEGSEEHALRGELWELIRFPPEFPKCKFSLVSDPHHDRILVHLSDGNLLYACYPPYRLFKLLGRNVCPWSDVRALVDEVLYVYDPESARSVGLSAFDLSDGVKSLRVVWVTKRVGNIYLEDYVYDAMFYVGNHIFWFAHWSPDNLGNVNISFVKLNIHHMGDKIICIPVDFLTRRLESTLRVLDVLLPEVMVSTLPHFDAGMFATVPLNLDSQGMHIVVLARDEAGNLILQKVNLDTTPLGTEVYTLASGLELENGNIVLEEFQRLLIYPGLTPRLDGRIYYFEYMDGSEQHALRGEFRELIRFPPEFPKCKFSLVSDPHHDRILVHLSYGNLLYACYPHDCSFKLLGRNVCPWSDVRALVDEVLYVYDPESARSVGLSAFDLSDEVKSLRVVWVTKRVGNIYLEDYVYNAMFHVGYHIFWFAHWSPDNLGNVNVSFVKFNIYHIEDNIICTPFDFLTCRLESTLRVLDVLLPEVMVSTLPHIDAGFSPVPLSLDRTTEIESFVDLFEHLLALEAKWHKGESMEHTLHSCIYLQGLDSLKEYNLLYPMLRLSVASYTFAASDEERISFQSRVIGEEVEVKLKSLEDYFLFKKANCGDEDMEALYETCLQHVKFRKSLYFALRIMSNPVNQEKMINRYLDDSLAAFMQLSISTIASREAVGFTGLTSHSSETVSHFDSWSETVSHFEKLLLDFKSIFSYPLHGDLEETIRMVVRIHCGKPLSATLKHLKNMIVQDDKLYGHESMLSAVLRACCQRKLDNHPLVKTASFQRLGKLVLDMLKVLFEDLKTQRQSLLQISYGWGELENEMSTQRINRKKVADVEIIEDVGRFIVVQATWSILRTLTLGFETNMYNSNDYTIIYVCMIDCYRKMLSYANAGEENSKFLECCLNLSEGLVEVNCYVRDKVKTKKMKWDGEPNRERFRKLVKNGFDFEKKKQFIKEMTVTDSDLKSSLCFNQAYGLAQDLEKAGSMGSEAGKLKSVAEKNILAKKIIIEKMQGKMQGRSSPVFKFNFDDHAVFATLQLWRLSLT